MGNLFFQKEYEKSETTPLKAVEKRVSFDPRDMVISIDNLPKSEPINISGNGNNRRNIFTNSF